MTDDGCSKLITMILDQDGTAPRLMKELRIEFGLNTANVQHARGTGTGPARTRALRGYVSEKDILTVTVPASRADEIFTALYERAEIGARYGGMMYQTALKGTHVCRLPELPEEE